MKNILAAISIFAVSAASSAQAEEWRKSIPDRIKKSLYPIALDVDWGSENGLWIFVADNGENRDGLALAACSSLQMYDDTPRGQLVIIRIFDALTASAGQGSGLLGYNKCET